MTRISKNSVQETYAALAAATLILFLFTLQNIPSVQAEASCAAVSSSVSLGSRGEDVMKLQNILIRKGFLPADLATGYFGPSTRKAVQQFQSKEGIASSGTEASTGYGSVGAKTRELLNQGCTGSTASASPTSSSKPASSATAACSPIIFPLGKIPEGTVGSSWTVPLISIKDGKNLPTFTTTGLPPGVTLKDQKVVISTTTEVFHNWVLTGTTTEVGSYFITISGKNGCSTAATSIQFTVNPGTPGITGIPNSTQCVRPAFNVKDASSATVGSSWKMPILQAYDGPYVPNIVTTGLPAGISVQDVKTKASSSTPAVHNFELTGTPTEAGVSTVRLVATNACGGSTITVTLPINRMSTVTPTSPTYIRCPNAPATPMCGTGAQISLGLDSSGCSLGYRCERPSFEIACPLYQMPPCPTGQHAVGSGVDSNGCSLPPMCKPDTQLSCPIFMPRVCSLGEHLVGGGIGKDGCSLSPRCESDTPTPKFSASPLSGSRPLTVLFSSMVGGGLPQAPAPLFRINFGDGAFAEATPCYAPSDFCMSPGINSHTYMGAGVYTATLDMYTGSHCGLPQYGNTTCSSIDAMTNLGSVTIKVD